MTNKTGLPAPLVNLAQELVNNHPKFENNRFSVTEMLKSEQQIVLSRTKDDEIELDVQDTFPLWEGTAMHKLLEDSTPEGFITEERGEYEIAPNIFISGAFDCLDKETWTLIDYKNPKIPSVHDAIYGKDDKWKRQMYFYALIIEKMYGRRPEKAKIVAMCKDHSRVKAYHDPTYQQEPIAMVEFDLMDQEFATEVRCEYEEKAKRVFDLLQNGKEPSPCTYGDMWCNENWAVMKYGATRAVQGGVFDNPDSAYMKWCSMPDNENYRIYHRVSEPVNCMLYCQCRSVCKQWQRFRDADIAICEDVTNSIIPF